MSFGFVYKSLGSPQIAFPKSVDRCIPTSEKSRVDFFDVKVFGKEEIAQPLLR
jgi:hypothetical protein